MNSWGGVRLNVIQVIFIKGNYNQFQKSLSVIFYPRKLIFTTLIHQHLNVGEYDPLGKGCQMADFTSTTEKEGSDIKSVLESVNIL